MIDQDSLIRYMKNARDALTEAYLDASYLQYNARESADRQMFMEIHNQLRAMRDDVSTMLKYSEEITSAHIR